MIGTVAGGIIIPLVWAALWGISDVTDPIELLMGALVGLGTSAAFWLIVRNGIK